MKYVGVLIMAMFMMACEKTITLNPESRQPLLVVDGTIESGKAPIVFLSNSLDYFGKINPQILLSSLAKGAMVYVTDGTDTSVLKEYNLPLGGDFSLTYYTTDTTNQAAFIRGERGKTYQLHILYKEQTYTATTTIPSGGKILDSIWWKVAPFQPDTSTKVVLMARQTDPPGFGDYIRYFTKVNDEQFLPGQFSVFDDQITDGTVYDFQVDQGIDRNNPPTQEDYGFFKKGDSITVKYANIDKRTYDFWRTIEFAYSNVGNPFSSPTKVLGNVSNNALGAFCGYNVTYKTLTVPR